MCYKQAQEGVLFRFTEVYARSNAGGDVTRDFHQYDGDDDDTRCSYIVSVSFFRSHVTRKWPTVSV